jgi:hypothetical protein
VTADRLVEILCWAGLIGTIAFFSAYGLYMAYLVICEWISDARKALAARKERKALEPTPYEKTLSNIHKLEQMMEEEQQ